MPSKERYYTNVNSTTKNSTTQYYQQYWVLLISEPPVFQKTHIHTEPLQKT